MSTPHDLELERILQARREVGTTTVHPPVARCLVAVFLLTLVTVPLIDQLAGGVGSAAAERLAVALGRAAETLGAGRPIAANRELLGQIETVEDELEEDSATAAALRPELQGVLTGCLGSGNEKALVGRHGWLFYRPDVEYLTGPGFLEPRVLERRARGGKSWRHPPEPDPRPALVALARAFADRGVHFVLLPAPAKPMAAPEELSARFAGRTGAQASGRELQNPSWERFRTDLAAAGVEVVDPPPASFLRTDSHWRPDAVDATAAALARRIEDQGLLTDIPEAAFSWHRETRVVTGHGDLAGMLELPAGWRLIEPETVKVERVEGPGGEPWRSDPGAAVLLLGDSFTNVYSRAELGWGDSAGLAEQLSFHLERPVDVLAINDGTDLDVRRRIAGWPPERLAPKRVVIYQVALRELAFGDWQPVDPPLPPVAVGGAATEEPATGASQRIRVRATIAAVAAVPDPSSTPYRDALVALRLDSVRVQGDAERRGFPDEILTYTWGMRDRSLTDAARWLPGRQVELTLTPWAEVAPQLETFQRLELDDERALFLDTYWFGPR
ncbi:MAG: hypothetical protein KDD11_01980 [Acidobacteria bacterium]|nr:hypothetical protein [Acidobacteriota bacterium]